MKKLFTLWYKLTDRNFEDKVKSAKMTTKMIKESTLGRISHFYNEQGDQIRGYSNAVIRSRVVEHPLIAKYR